MANEGNKGKKENAHTISGTTSHQKYQSNSCESRSPVRRSVISRNATFLRVGEHQKETAQEFGQMLEQVEIGHRVEDADPTDDELSNIVIVVEHLLAVAIEGHANSERDSE